MAAHQEEYDAIRLRVEARLYPAAVEAWKQEHRLPSELIESEDD